LVGTIIPDALKAAVFQITPEDITKLKAGLSEALPVFLQKAIQGIKNAADKAAYTHTEKKLDKAVAKVDKQQGKLAASRLNELVLDAAKKATADTKISIKVENKNNGVDILFKSAYIAGVTYGKATAANQFRVNKCITAIAETLVDCSLAAFLNLINKKMGLKIDIKKFGDLLTFTGSSDAEVKALHSYDAELKDTLSDEMLKALGESLNEDLQDMDMIKKYDTALALAETPEQRENLVKLFFFKAINIKLIDSEAEELAKAIYTVKTFDLDRSKLGSIFLTYYTKNNSSATVETELQDLTTLLTVDNFVDKLDTVDDIMYNKAFVTGPFSSRVTQDIYSKYKKVKYGKLAGNAIAMKLGKIKSVVKIDIPEPKTITKAEQLANFMIFEDYPAATKLRTVEIIKSIYDIISPKSSNNAADDKDNPAQATVNFVTPDTLTKIKNLLNTTADGGSEAVAELSRK